jgi:imidazolonepropionase
VPVLRNIGLLVAGPSAERRGALREVPRAAVAFEGGVVRWAGPEASLPARHAADEAWDAGGRLVVPGLVDCHTHVVFGGWRTAELEQKLQGRGYLEIARAGGGIAATVAMTRELSDDALAARAAGFLREMASLGVTTVEAKSGYGLEPDEELRLLRLQRRLGREVPLRVVSTLLAHVVPAAWRERRAEYVERFAGELVPAAARAALADACDVYVDEGAFTPEEARRILRAALDAGLPVKVHAEQLGPGGGAALAAELGALSADHLEHLTAEGVERLARAGCVAVTLPLAALFLGAPPAPARALLDAGVPVAVATDFNTGSAPSSHLPLAMLLACTRQRMTPAEALIGATSAASRALGLEGRAGTLDPGASADLAVIDDDSVAGWLLHFRPNACVLTVAAGRPIWRAGAEPRP